MTQDYGSFLNGLGGSYDYFSPDLLSAILQNQGQWLNNDQFYAQLGLTREQFEEQIRQWEQTFGLTRNQAIAQFLASQQAQTGYIQTQPYLDANGNVVFGGETTNSISRDVANWNYELGKGGLGLNYLELLGSLSGPRDWLNYARTVRGAEGTGLPVWADALASGQALPAFGAAYQANQLSPMYDSFLGQQQNLPQWANGIVNTGQPANTAPMQDANMAYAQTAAQPTQAATQRAMPQWAMPLAQKITQAQWNRLLPSEQEMFMGAVENAGQYAPDYLQQMQNSWGSTRKITPVTHWG